MCMCIALMERRNYRLTKLQLREIETIIEGHVDELKAAWHQHFGS